MDRVTVFDTTLRDGEQSPGSSMTAGEKLRMAEELAALGVDVIEAGFPSSSSQDLEAVRRIGRELRRPVIAALARAHHEDIDCAAEGLEAAAHPRIHTFIDTSDIHLEHKLRISREDCLRRIREAVSRARSHTDDVEFSAEDATRTDLVYLCQVVQTAIDHGATTINIPDTVGYAIPADFTRIMDTLRASVRGIEDVTLSVHCHDDLGLAVANSLVAIQHGARQVECTVNGIGERAGNASLEEIVMALRVRHDFGDFDTAIHSERLCPASQLLAHIIGVRPQPNKAIVGENAFAHEAGIHQDGMLKNPMTYEIMTPEMVGARKSRLALGRHSGRHALVHSLKELGYELDPNHVDQAYSLFRLLADTKKTILEEDLLAIYYQGTLEDAPRLFRLDHLHVVCGRTPSHATVSVREGNGPPQEAEAEGDGPIDAAFAALQEVVPWEVRLEDFSLQANSPGTDAVGEAHLRLRINGHAFSGRSASTDVVDAAARAYLNAVDKASYARSLEARAFERAEYWGV